MHLSSFPRVHLAHLPTPLEPMKRLSKELGVELWIKRDDCTGMSTGGNKTRKLEFLMAEALEQGADMVMTQGATQTNHGRRLRPMPPSWGSIVISCLKIAPAMATQITIPTATCCWITCMAQRPRNFPAAMICPQKWSVRRKRSAPRGGAASMSSPRWRIEPDRRAWLCELRFRAAWSGK